ncbi:MAG: N-formylglutamate amidohydrolase [Planctomycetota bacterium]|jgi:hypothetical protein
MEGLFFSKKESSTGPIVTSAIHSGNRLRKDIENVILIDEQDRLREEDPFTASWLPIGNTQIEVFHSRFEVDLNRSREKAVYKNPDDAWGLNLWEKDLSKDLIDKSLAEYDLFYSEMHKLFNSIKEKYGFFIVIDFHSYNHRRNGPDKDPESADLNPDINIGTASIVDPKWRNIINRFISQLQNIDYCGRKLDVRENIKFKGGNFVQWINKNFSDSACGIAVEVKKFFMDEWTGIPDHYQIEELRKTFQSTVPVIIAELVKLGAKW